MRNMPAIVLVICGTVLLLTPAIFNHLGARAGMRASYSDSMTVGGLTWSTEWYLHVGGMVAIVSGALGAALSFIVEISRPGFWRS